MVKLHLGCGKRDFGIDWINIDSQRLPHIQYHDVTKLPFEDNTVGYIYASHLIAYFDREEIIPILKEWRRVMEPMGKLRIATPDWGVLRRMASPLLGPLYGKMNEPAIYHKTVYDYNGLKDLLELCGFNSVGFYDHKKTEHAAFDDHSAAYYKDILISLNVQCYA